MKNNNKTKIKKIQNKVFKERQVPSAAPGCNGIKNSYCHLMTLKRGQKQLNSSKRGDLAEICLRSLAP